MTNTSMHLLVRAAQLLGCVTVAMGVSSSGDATSGRTDPTATGPAIAASTASYRSTTTSSSASVVATTATILPSVLVERPCDIAVEAAADCYWFEVPERRDVATSRRIRLWVAVMTPADTPDGAVPWVILSGGPGNAVSTGWVAGTATFRPTPSPVIVMDQRGSGRSQPRLDCVHPLTIDDVLLPWTERRTALRDAARECRRQLIEQHIDLDGYDTTESAADFAELRTALGIDVWDVYGYSYGGRLALELASQDPEGIRSLHVDSPLPTTDYGPADLIADADTQLGRVAAACAAQLCANGGAFESRLSAAFERLERSPHRVTPPGGTEIVFDGDQMLFAVRLAMYNTAAIAAVPAAVDAIAAGDNAFLDGIAGVLAGPPPADPADATAMGTFAVVLCADDPPDNQRDQEVIAAPGRWSSLIAFWPWHSCDIWDVDSSPQVSHPAHDFPTLLTLGEFDVIPAARAIPEVQAVSTNVQIIELPGGGHIVARANECILALSESFRANPAASLDDSCLLALPPTFAS